MELSYEYRAEKSFNFNFDLDNFIEINDDEFDYEELREKGCWWGNVNYYAEQIIAEYVDEDIEYETYKYLRNKIYDYAVKRLNILGIRVITEEE